MSSESCSADPVAAWGSLRIAFIHDGVEVADEAPAQLVGATLTGLADRFWVSSCVVPSALRPLLDLADRRAPACGGRPRR